MVADILVELCVEYLVFAAIFCLYSNLFAANCHMLLNCELSVIINTHAELIQDSVTI